MAFLDLIPLVGATLGGLVLAAVCAIVDFPTALIIWGIVFIVYQQVENNLLQPLVYRRTVDVSPLLVIVSILIGSTLLGVRSQFELPVALAAVLLAIASGLFGLVIMVGLTLVDYATRGWLGVAGK